MSNLTIINHSGQKTIDSREVAEMVDKQHKNLLADIRGYISAMSTQLNFQPSDFFIESVYQDSTGRTLPRFLITKKGCDMVANKLTGEKGVLFSAAYINKFYEMEQSQLPAPTDPLDLIIMQATAMKELRQRQEVQERVQAEQAQELKILAAKMETSPKDYFTVVGFANLRGIRLDVNRASLLGRKAATLSKEYGYEIGKTSDPRFGQVGTYHVDILAEVFLRK